LGAFGNGASNAGSRIELNGVRHCIDHIGLSPWFTEHIPRKLLGQIRYAFIVEKGYCGEQIGQAVEMMH